MNETDTGSSGEKCCREIGVPDVCFGFCRKEHEKEVRKERQFGICEKWIPKIDECRGD